MKNDLKKKTGKKVAIGALLFVAVCVIAFFAYVMTYYHAENVDSYMNGDDMVSVTKINVGWFFDGPGSESAMIFYPGGKVETEAYSPLMYKLSAEGYDCFLVDMPFRLAFFGSDRASDIYDNYNYDKWYLAGHSLGGAFAGRWASLNSEKLDGIVFLASYSTYDMSDADFSALSIWGNMDGVVNLSNLEKNKKNLPKEHTEAIIDGANHAGFAEYGFQKGDKISLLGSEEQIDLTVDLITDFFNR